MHYRNLVINTRRLIECIVLKQKHYECAVISPLKSVNFSDYTEVNWRLNGFLPTNRKI